MRALDGFDRVRGRASAPTELVGLYRSMLRIRRIEEEIERRYHQDQMKTPIHLVIGQEATAVGCCAALRTTDLVYSSHRTHGAYLAKGGDLKAMLCEMHCRINGCVGIARRLDAPHRQARRHGRHVGHRRRRRARSPSGAALAAQMKRDDRVVVVFLGDATTEEGVTSESLNFAALKKLPVVFFCENNFYSVQSPLATRQPPRDIRAWAASHGMPAVAVDGVNVLAVHDAVGGRGRARASRRRTDVHRGAGLSLSGAWRRRRRQPDRLSRRGRARAWEAVDPLRLFGEYLTAHGSLDDDAVAGDGARDRRRDRRGVRVRARAARTRPKRISYRHVTRTERAADATRMPWDEGLVNSLVYDRPDPSEGRVVSYAQAINEALALALEQRPARVRARPGRRRSVGDVRHDARPAAAVRRRARVRHAAVRRRR